MSSLKESVDYIKPDVIIGCESWLSSDYTNSENFPLWLPDQCLQKGSKQKLTWSVYLCPRKSNRY